MSDEQDERTYSPRDSDTQQNVPAAEAAAEPNPWIGTPHVAQQIQPPAVIHSLGDAHPGEANPARGHGEEFYGDAPVDTAALLADREDAEARRLSADGAVGTSASPLLVDDLPADLEQLDQEYEDVYLAGQNQLDNVSARYATEEQQTIGVIERSQSNTGLAFSESRYEREEMHQPMPPSDLSTVPRMSAVRGSDADKAVTVAAVFNDSRQAAAAVSGLLSIGIAEGDITMQSDDPDAPDDGAYVEPAGEETYRAASTALPNDEDLPSTVAAQAGTTANATDDPGGLSRDEGLVPRIEAPADPDIYSDFSQSDADYRTKAGEGAAQTGALNPDTDTPDLTDSGATGSAAWPQGPVRVTVQTDRLRHAAVIGVLRTHGAADVG